MADLNVRIVIQMLNKTPGAGRKVASSLKEIEKQGKRASNAFDLSANLTLAGQGVTQLTSKARGLLQKPLETTLKFEDAMARVGAKAQATDEDLAALEQEARRLGSSTRFSATKAAEGLEFFAIAGFDARESIAALEPTLNLASATATDLGRSADIASDIMGGFGLEADQAARVADVLATQVVSSNTGLQQLSETMTFVAPVAKTAGISLEKTAAIAGLLADAGIKGSTAGTSLRAILLAMAAPSRRAQKAMKALKIEFEDAAGNLRQPEETLVDLQKQLEGLGTGKRLKALARIFGREPAAAINVLLENTSKLNAETGENAILTAISRNETEAQGRAAEIAAKQNATMAGQVASLKSAQEELEIVIGQKLAPVLTELIQENIIPAVKSFAEWADKHPELVKQLGFLAAGVVAVGTVLGPLLLTVGAMSGARGMLGMALGTGNAAAALDDMGNKIPLTRYQKFSSITGKLIGALPAMLIAFEIGRAFGTWADETFRLSDALAGVNREQDKLAKGRAAKLGSLTPEEREDLQEATEIREEAAEVTQGGFLANLLDPFAGAREAAAQERIKQLNRRGRARELEGERQEGITQVTGEGISTEAPIEPISSFDPDVEEMAVDASLLVSVQDDRVEVSDVTSSDPDFEVTSDTGLSTQPG